MEKDRLRIIASDSLTLTTTPDWRHPVVPSPECDNDQPVLRPVPMMVMVVVALGCSEAAGDIM